MYGIIYCATNSVNGKRYVGQTTRTLKWRWRWHLHYSKIGSRNLLHKAIRKYGVEVFAIEQIDSADSCEELNSKEILHIKRLASFGPGGYNLTSGGEGGFLRSEETRWKISEAKTNPSAEIRQRLSKSHLCFVPSKETREKISASNSGQRRSEETKRRISESNTKEVCKNGHARTATNTYISPTTGGRQCLICWYTSHGKTFQEQRKEEKCVF